MGHPPWDSDGALNAHIDSHLLGVLDGEVSELFMRERGWVVCRVCGKSAFKSRRGAELRTSTSGARDERSHLDDGWEEGGWAEQLRNLPAITDVFLAACFTKEFT